MRCYTNHKHVYRLGDALQTRQKDIRYIHDKGREKTHELEEVYKALELHTSCGSFSTLKLNVSELEKSK